MLKMFYDGSDYVIADDAYDAVAIWEEQSGPGSLHPSRQTGDAYHEVYAFEECLADEMCEIFIETEGPVTKTHKEWIEHFNKKCICFSDNW